MERRAASHTEEEELNQRRRLLNQARKGDPKAISRLFELYQVRVYSGDLLSKPGRIPQWPSAHQHQNDSKRHSHSKAKSVKKKSARRPARSTHRTAASKSRQRRKAHR